MNTSSDESVDKLIDIIGIPPGVTCRSDPRTTPDPSESPGLAVEATRRRILRVRRRRRRRRRSRRRKRRGKGLERERKEKVEGKRERGG